MSTSPRTTTTDPHRDAATWQAPIARAIPALALAAVVTFSADHSARLGLITLGAYAAITGIALTVIALRSRKGIVRSLSLTQGIVTLLTGIAALAVTGGGQSYFVFVLSGFAAVTGFIELYLGLRRSGREKLAREWTFVGGLTALLAIVVLVIPPDFSHPFTGPDGVDRELTASIVTVGVLGAYWAILGVYLIIAGLTLRWATTDTVVAPASTPSAEA